MELIVMPHNRTVIKNRETLLFPDFPIVDENIECIKWYGGDGETHYKDGTVEAFTDPEYIQPYLDLYAEEAQRQYAAANPTYTEAELLEIERTRKYKEIMAARNEALDGGITWNGREWDSDSTARDNLTGILTGISAGMELPAVFSWRSKDNKNVPMTSAELAEFGAAMLEHVTTQYQKSWILKDQLTQATNIVEVKSIGWF